MSSANMSQQTFHALVLATLIGLVASYVAVNPSDSGSNWDVTVSKKCRENDLHPINGSCDSQWYCECVYGAYVLKICPLGKIYDPYTKACKPWAPANCTVTPSPVKPREPCCAEGKIKAEPSDCLKYQVCTNGYWTDQSCRFGYYFNSVNLDCEGNWLCYYCKCPLQLN